MRNSNNITNSLQHYLLLIVQWQTVSNSGNSSNTYNNTLISTKCTGYYAFLTGACHLQVEDTAQNCFSVTQWGNWAQNGTIIAPKFVIIILP